MKRLARIGVAAAALGVSQATLRRWDRGGRLTPHRHPINNYRLYDLDEVRRLVAPVAAGRAGASATGAIAPAPNTPAHTPTSRRRAADRALARRAGAWASALFGAEAASARAQLRGKRTMLLAAHARAVAAADAALALTLALALETPLGSDGEVALLARLLDDGLALPADAAEARGLRARAFLARARTEWMRGRHHDALATLARARSEARAAADRVTAAEAFAAEGVVYRQLRRFDDARASLRTAIRLHRQAASRRLEGLAWGALGSLCHEGGKLRAARACYERADARLAAARDRWSRAVALGSLGNVLHELGQREAAARSYRGALAIFAAFADQRHRGIFAGYLALLHHEHGSLPAAQRGYQQAIAWLAAADAPRFEGLFRACRGAALAATDPDRARDEFGRAEAIVADTADGALRACVQVHRGHLDLASGDLAAAERRLRLGQRRQAESDDLRAALRLLAAALAEPPGWLCAAEGGNRLRLPDGRRLSLARRPALRRVLTCLLQARLARGSRVQSASDLFANAWAGERALPAAAAHRVRVAIATLRDLGLKDLIVSEPGGYRLRDDVPVRAAGII